METNYHHLVKILLVGDLGVGKSSLMVRASEGTYTDTFISTIGVDFKIKTITVGDKIVKTQIWDTAGQERFRSLSSAYYKGAHVIILTFDVTNDESFNNLTKWHEEATKFASPEVKFLVVGNKTDKETERQVSSEDGLNFATTIGAGYLETSAKNGSNVDEMLHTAAGFAIGYQTPPKASREVKEMVKTTETPSRSQSQDTTTTSQDGKEYDFLLKHLFVGDAGVGKSSLLLRMTDGIFTGTYLSTIGVDFKFKTITVGGKTFKNMLWDTAGQERFRSLSSAYYKGAHVISLIFDVTDYESFNNLKVWYQEVEQYAPSEVKLLVVGNKTDLESARQVPTEDGLDFATKIGANYIETSAKNGSNVDEMLQTAASIGVGMNSQDPSKDSKDIKTPSKTESQSTTKIQERSLDYLFKLLLVGATKTGKSCILQRYLDNNFSDNYTSTLGIDFKNKSLEAYGKKVKLQIWDTAGEEKYKAVVSAQYQGAHGVVLVYDVTNRESFAKVQSLHEDIKGRSSDKVKFIIAGNKSDLDSQREVSYDEGTGFAEGIGSGFLEISAKSGENVQDLFTIMLTDLLGSQ
mgnify:CR=1 FL=1